jgi:hypothetical protein
LVKAFSSKFALELKRIPYIYNPSVTSHRNGVGINLNLCSEVATWITRVLGVYALILLFEVILKKFYKLNGNFHNKKNIIFALDVPIEYQYYLIRETCSCPGVDSSSSINEYQEYLLGVKTAGVTAEYLTSFLR